MSIASFSFAKAASVNWNMNEIEFDVLNKFRLVAHQHMVESAYDVRALKKALFALREMFRVIYPLVPKILKERTLKDFDDMGVRVDKAVKNYMEAEAVGDVYNPPKTLYEDMSSLFDNIYMLKHFAGFGVHTQSKFARPNNPYQRAMDNKGGGVGFTNPDVPEADENPQLFKNMDAGTNQEGSGVGESSMNDGNTDGEQADAV